MQNREELRQKATIRVPIKKQCIRRGGEMLFSEGGGVINIIFGPKYRTLLSD
jgi:hypothetical protein